MSAATREEKEEWMKNIKLVHWHCVLCGCSVIHSSQPVLWQCH